VDRHQTLSFNERNIAEFRTSHGRIASFGHAPLLLLTSPGAKSGQRRTNPMMYLADEHDSNRVYVFASNAGADQNPAGSTTSSPTPTISRSSWATIATARPARFFPNRGALRSMESRPAVIPASPSTERRRHGRSR
jgi:hypothetical protein